jgi:hypothetical protein
MIGRTKNNTIAITTILSIITAVTALLSTGTIEEIFKVLFTPLPQPIAVAGGSDSVYERDDIYLTGKNSYSDNGNIKNYFWDYLRGPPPKIVSIHNKEAIVPAPLVTTDSEITFQLKVIDEKNKQNTAIHSVKIKDIKDPPKAVVQTNYSVTDSQNFVIDGSNSTGSSPDSELTYEWKVLSGPPNLNIIYNDTATPIVTIPDVESDTNAKLLFTVHDVDTNKIGIEFVNIYIRNEGSPVPATYTFSNAFTQIISYQPSYLEKNLHHISATYSKVTNQSNQSSFIHPLKTDGNNWQLNLNDIEDEKTVLYDAKVTRNPDESWKLIPESRGSADGMTLYAYTPGYANSNKMITKKDHRLFEDNGYIFNEKDWKDVEINAYIRINSYSDDNGYFATDVRGGRHNEDNICVGTSYRNQLYSDGNLQFKKEQWHPILVSAEPVNIGQVIGEWIGIKTIIQNVNNNGKSEVKMETYIDKSNKGGDWVKINEKIDSGNWGDAGEKCNGNPDQIITWGGPVISFFFRGITDIDIQDFATREI